MTELAGSIARSKALAFAGMDVPWMLEQWVARTPDATAFVWEPFEGASRRWSYAELALEARRIARGLSRRGVGPDDFVIVHLDNSPEFVFAWFACAYLGAVAVSTNTRCVARDLEYFAEHVDAVAAITQPAYASMIAGACPRISFLVCSADDAGAPAAIPDGVDAVPFTDLHDDEPIEVRPPDPAAKLSVQFTSGTTSRPKAVLWSHANGLWAARMGAVHLRLRREDVTLVFMPLFHTNAQGWSMLPTLWSGGTFVLQPKFSASRFWDLSLKHRASWLSTIPFAMKAVMDQPVPEHHYRFWATAAHLPDLAAHFRVPILGWWGMTETLTMGTICDVDHPGPARTIGRVAPGIDLEIRGADGAPVAPGERGVLHVRGVPGVSLFAEYYRNAGATASAFDADGWFDTGDIVRMDEAGNLFFSDREKDMLKVGAENVAASEIEAVVLATGLVSECAVVGRRHAMLDEVPVAFVIPAPGATGDLPERIVAHCREQLADFKVPQAVILVDELPRSTLEKVAKAELRARLPDIEAS